MYADIINSDQIERTPEKGVARLAGVSTITQKRSWPAITVDILETVLTPSNKMRVMYRSNLNFERFSKYFHDLMSKGFIEEMDNGNGRSLYKITERGRTLLEVLRKAHDLALSEEDSV